MSTYLVLRCGDYGMLLSARQVVEVGERGGTAEVDAADAAEGRRLWRERALEVVDLPDTLGVPTVARQHEIVVHDGADEVAPLVLLDVGAVEDLVELPDDAFGELVCVTPELGARFDACYLDPDTGSMLLRLRLPLGRDGTAPSDDQSRRMR